MPIFAIGQLGKDRGQDIEGEVLERGPKTRAFVDSSRRHSDLLRWKGTYISNCLGFFYNTGFPVLSDTNRNFSV